MPPNVTACLLSWKRRPNIQPIVESLLPFEWIDEILIWDNDHEGHPIPIQVGSFGNKSFSVIQTDENEGTWGRYLAAKIARNKTIFCQDDDYLIGNQQAIYDAFVEAGGNTIVNALDEGHFRNDMTTARHLVGWGTIFPKSAIECFGKWIADRGEDALLKSKADRIFPILCDLEWKHVRADETPLDGVQGSMALYREKDHWTKTQEAIREAQRIAGHRNWGGAHA